VPGEHLEPIRRGDEALRMHDVGVDYAGVTALNGIDLTVGTGEVVALLGPSGSGKSTLLQAVAGLVRPTRGEIWVAGRLVASGRHSTPPERRAVGMVFQGFALWPHLSALDTVAYPMRRAGHSRREAAAAATTLLAQLGIDHLARRRPAELSGGEQQRVGLARALAREARLYLLDEPTAHLDTHLRSEFEDAVLTRQRESGAAVIYTTHDAGEALAIAHRVALLVDGTLIQVAPPATVYAEPVSATAAALTGPSSVLSLRACATRDGHLSIDIGEGTVVVPGAGTDSFQSRWRQVLLRPEWVRVGGPLRGRIVAVAFRGPHTDYRLDIGIGSIVVREAAGPRHAVGELLCWAIERAWVLDEPDAESGDRAQPSALIAPE
jgi:ABC-type Fe3+/spermidine/putrescine transport system ATPase subunit